MSDFEMEEKRIVLVGVPGSGKTMLAIGLYKLADGKGARKGVSINVDAGASGRLKAFVDDIETTGAFPQPTPLISGAADGQNDRRRYPFKFVGFRRKTFSTVIEDYAGERASNPEHLKEFDAIIGKDPYGAVLLLNPGMSMFKVANGQMGGQNKIALSTLYKTMIERLYEKGCRNFVLAITAYDRISTGGDLRKTVQRTNFEGTLKGILDFFKAKKRTKKASDINYKVVPVTVTGRLKYDDRGEVSKVHLAEGRNNTAADPFLWIIDPWRERFRKLAKLFAWAVPTGLALLFSLYVGIRTWNGMHIERYLNEAESELATFGNISSVDFDSDKGQEKLVAAEARLQEVNDAWLVNDTGKKAISKRFSGLLGMLMTNQVNLAYYKLKPKSGNNDWIDPSRSLDGESEFGQWPYWERSAIGKEAHAAAVEFRNVKTRQLNKDTLEADIVFLITSAGTLNAKSDEDVRSFLTRAIIVNESLGGGKGSDDGLNNAVKTVYEKFENSVGEEEYKRFTSAIPENFDTDHFQSKKEDN